MQAIKPDILPSHKGSGITRILIMLQGCNDSVSIWINVDDHDRLIENSRTNGSLQ